MSLYSSRSEHKLCKRGCVFHSFTPFTISFNTFISITQLNLQIALKSLYSKYISHIILRIHTLLKRTVLAVPWYIYSNFCRAVLLVLLPCRALVAILMVSPGHISSLIVSFHSIRVGSLFLILMYFSSPWGLTKMQP